MSLKKHLRKREIELKYRNYDTETILAFLYIIIGMGLALLIFALYD